MRKSGWKVALVGAGGLCLLAGAASASPPYTVEVGGSSAVGTHTFTGTSGLLTIGSAGCTSATIAGTVTSGPSGVNPVVAISSLTATGCGAWTLTMSSTPWAFDGVDPASVAATDDVAGTLGLAAHVQYTSVPALCQYDVTGAAVTHFDESTQVLTLDDPFTVGDALVSNVSGCLGLVASGDPTSVSGAFALSVPDGAVNLS